MLSIFTFLMLLLSTSSFVAPRSLTLRHRFFSRPLTALFSSSSSSPPSAALADLRSLMKDEGVDAYIVPSDDPHLSEYASPCYQRRAFLTDFDGSAGVAVVTQEDAKLWTDARYWEQAGMQLSKEWDLMKAGNPDCPTLVKVRVERGEGLGRVKGLKLFCSLLAQHITYKTAHPSLRSAIQWLGDSSKVQTVGLDPFLHPPSFVKELNETLATSSNPGSISFPSSNLIDKIWDSQPPLPDSQFRVHPIEYAGVDVAAKLKVVRSKMKEENAEVR
jgi:Xaa-Pro aminopeptidase